MCVGVPAKIIELKDDTAVADILGVQTEISVALLTDLRIDDYVVLHAGVAISKISEEEAQSTIEIMRELGEMMDDRQR